MDRTWWPLKSLPVQRLPQAPTEDCPRLSALRPGWVRFRFLAWHRDLVLAPPPRALCPPQVRPDQLLLLQKPLTSGDTPSLPGFCRNLIARHSQTLLAFPSPASPLGATGHCPGEPTRSLSNAASHLLSALTPTAGGPVNPTSWRGS